MRCRKCKRKVSGYAKECPYCKERLKKDEIAVRSYVVQVQRELHGDAGGTKEKEKIRRRKIRIVILSGIFLFFFLAAILREHKQRWLITEDTVFYEKDHMLMAKDLSSNEIKQVAKLTFDGQPYRDIKHMQQGFVFYRNNSHELYYVNDMENKLGSNTYSVYSQDTDDLVKQPKCIDRNIVAHAWDEEGDLFYMKLEEDTLYRYNGHKKEHITLANMNAITYIPSLKRLLITQDNSEEAINDNVKDSYDTEEKAVGKNRFYLVNPKTLEIEDLGVIPEGKYAFTADYKHLYMLKENQILDYDLKDKTSSLLMNNVYDFSLVNSKGKDRLYYIAYNIKKRNLYSCYKDPYSKLDEKTKSGANGKESSKERTLRQNRERFREELKNQTIGEYSGTLYCYEDGEIKKIANEIGGFEWADQTEAVIVYKTGKIDWTGFEIQQDVTAKSQRTLASLSDMQYDGDDEEDGFTYDELVEYTVAGEEPTAYECVKGKATLHYLVQEDKVQEYSMDDKKEYVAEGSFQKCKDDEYEVLIQGDGSAGLYKCASGQNQKGIMASIIEYYVSEAGKVIVLQGDKKDHWNIVEVQKDGEKLEIDNNVQAIFAKSIWSVKDEPVTILEE